MRVCKQLILAPFAWSPMCTLFPGMRVFQAIIAPGLLTKWRLLRGDCQHALSEASCSLSLEERCILVPCISGFLAFFVVCFLTIWRFPGARAGGGKRLLVDGGR